MQAHLNPCTLLLTSAEGIQNKPPPFCLRNHSYLGQQRSKPVRPQRNSSSLTLSSSSLQERCRRLSRHCCHCCCIWSCGYKPRGRCCCHRRRFCCCCCVDTQRACTIHCRCCCWWWRGCCCCYCCGGGGSCCSRECSCSCQPVLQVLQAVVLICSCVEVLTETGLCLLSQWQWQW